jgi:hypothetical protein
MRSPTRPDGAERFRTMMQGAGLNTEQAAELCFVSRHTVIAWLKPTYTMSHNRCPEWAVELLRLKIEERNRNAGHQG